MQKLIVSSHNLWPWVYNFREILPVVLLSPVQLFGAMASSYLRLSDHFYGTGESCLFTFDNEESLEVFPWTGLNSYFIKGNTESLVIGSGE